MLSQSHYDFADRLRQARHHAGFTGPADAARAHGWNGNTYKSRENSKRGIPDHEDVKLYAEAFKVSFLWLLAGEGEKPSWLKTDPEGTLKHQVSGDEDRQMLPDSTHIQVSLVLLRKHLLASAHSVGISEARGRILSDVLIASLSEAATPLTLLPVAEKDHTRIGSEGPEPADQG